MAVVLITGTSKGLGFELAQHYLRKDYIVIGISRSESKITHPNYHHCAMDVADEASTNGLAAFLDTLPISRIDILVNSAGYGGTGYHLSEIDPQEVTKQVNLHCVGALRITQVAQRYLRDSKIVNVTSRLGSIKQNERGDFAECSFSYSYRIGKCAQNMLSLCMANDPELSGSIVISMNPGLLKTDSGASDASHTAAEGANAFASVVSGATTSGVYHAFGDEAAY